MATRSPRTRTRLEKAILWCDTQHEVTVTFHKKRALARVYFPLDPPLSSGWRRSVLAALDRVRGKVEAWEKRKAKKR